MFHYRASPQKLGFFPLFSSQQAIFLHHSLSLQHVKRVWGSVPKMKEWKKVWKLTVICWNLNEYLHSSVKERNFKKTCRPSVKKLTYRKHLWSILFISTKTLYGLCLITFDFKCVNDQLRPLEKWEQVLKRSKWEVWILDRPLSSTEWP